MSGEQGGRLNGHIVSASRIKAGLLIFSLSAITVMIMPWQMAPESAEGHGAASTIKGRIELINSKIKLRNGNADASGVVIWLDSPEGARFRSGARQRAVIVQHNKRFTPHVVAVETGSQVDFPNDDPFFHNVF